MSKYLVVLAWPAGLVVILGIAFLLARRLPAVAGSSASADRAPDLGRRAGMPGLRPVRVAMGESGAFVALVLLGAVIVFGVMALLGLLVVHHGLAVDRPVFTWIMHHQVHAVAAVLGRLTKIGNAWTTWAAAAAAAVCLSVTWRTRRWLPPVVLSTLIFADHFTTLALRHVFERAGPPTSPLGTYPSGGCDRVIVFYGLIGYLLWREFSGRRRTGIWVAAVVAALGFNEAFSRVYLGLHWFTDALSGLLYGGLLLGVFVLALHLVTGRVPATRAARHRGARSPRREAPARQS
jgi:membrane-associated phospholipid phosphatase